MKDGTPEATDSDDAESSRSFQRMVRIRVTESPWGWWYGVGETYIVRKSPLQATDGGTVTACYCAECCKKRAGQQLYDIYEVVGGRKAGSIIPMIHVQEF